MPFEVYNGLVELYNGLGMRLTKSDFPGSYAYLGDGFSPASDVLPEGCSTFMPGISETKGVAGGVYALAFYLADAGGYNWDAFENLMSRFGSNPTGFAWNEGSGCQSVLAYLQYQHSIFRQWIGISKE